jgi:hypothetical protein
MDRLAFFLVQELLLIRAGAISEELGIVGPIAFGRKNFLSSVHVHLPLS